MTQHHVADEDLRRLQLGEHHDPSLYLGCHQDAHGYIFRAWLPTAEEAWVESLPLTRVEGSDLFTRRLTPAEQQSLPKHYTLHWEELFESRYQQVSSYSFAPQLGELDLHLFAEGRHWNVYQHLGASVREIDGVVGVLFAVWAPGASRVSVVGDFNGWNGLRHPMRVLGGSGVWELFIPGLVSGDLYKYEIKNAHSGEILLKTDPYARQMERRPGTASTIYQSCYAWQDAEWMTQRRRFKWQQQPISIYEVHLGSWQRDDTGEFLNYRELADRLVDYASWMGFTHIELLPITEHPLDQSWGYQTSGYFAPTSRFGAPDDLRYLIDRCHQAQIGVLLDWVPAHFPKDRFALARFDGTALYEHADPRRGEHLDWGTLIFNYARNEVRNFLIANALYWLKEFHIDGLRVDAVASMLYLDYSRNNGDWLPNQYGGRENLDAIEFLQTLNHEIAEQCPGALTMAEESTSWPMVTRPTWTGGLGFNMKWNMGWMNDTLDYFELDPIHRSYHHNQLTFNQMYAYSENFILPLSHDEVVHLKGSLAGKMPGDDWQKLANLRLLLAYQWLNPGKKLLFMGGEMGQWTEWNENISLDWEMVNHPNHRGVQLLVRDLNQLYQTSPALYQHEFAQQGFEWIDCHDYPHSTLSFLRVSESGETLACVFNFTPVPREDHTIGLPNDGIWREVLNSDGEIYGGGNVGNAGQVLAEPLPAQEQPCSAKITLPPLGVVVFMFNGDQGESTQ